MKYFLAGDVGGTKTILATFDEHLHMVHAERYHSKGYAKFEEIMHSYMKIAPKKLSAACMAVAGPVIKGACKTTNLPWLISEAGIARITSISKVALINDFEAAGHGVLATPRRGIATLFGKEGQGTKAVLGPGTGLGEAILAHINGGYEVLPSEGGHSEFAPRNEHEWQLKQWLLKHGFADVESVLSGPGLVNIYAFLKESGLAKESTAVAIRFKQEDKAAVIAEFGRKKQDRLCETALSWFMSFLGMEASQLALKAKATGGVYIVGSIANKNVNALHWPALKKAFLAGRMKKFVQNIPVYVVRDELVGLRGAAAVAREL